MSKRVLRPGAIEKIVAALKAGEPGVSVSQRFGVTQGYISQIRVKHIGSTRPKRRRTKDEDLEVEQDPLPPPPPPLPKKVNPPKPGPLGTDAQLANCATVIENLLSRGKRVAYITSEEYFFIRFAPTAIREFLEYRRKSWPN